MRFAFVLVDSHPAVNVVKVEILSKRRWNVLVTVTNHSGRSVITVSSGHVFVRAGYHIVCDIRPQDKRVLISVNTENKTARNRWNH